MLSSKIYLLSKSLQSILKGMNLQEDTVDSNRTEPVEIPVEVSLSQTLHIYFPSG